MSIAPLFKERSLRLDAITAAMRVQESHTLARVGTVSSAARQRIKESVNIYLWSCLQAAGMSVSLSDDMLADYEQQILALPNITPNGLVLPKHETLLSYNLFHAAVSNAFLELGLHEHIARIQYPVNLRLQSGAPDPAIDNRPRAATKTHSDIWAGDPASGIICFLAVAGSVENAGIRFLQPREFPAEFIRTLENFDEGLSIVQNAQEVCRFHENGWFLVDPYLLHQTHKSGSGTRLSVDFRFIPKQQVASDTFEDDARKPFFIPFDQWYEIGRSLMLVTHERMSDPKPAIQPYTVGYPVPIKLVPLV